MTDLKLIAFDADDLRIVSAHLQDAVIRVADMAYVAKDRRFAVLANRFDWTAAHAAPAAPKPKASGYTRRRTVLRFERVLGAQVQGIDLKSKRRVLCLLAVGFEGKGSDDPAGFVTLVFSGGGAVRLEVECLEAELMDLGAAWRTRRKPEHHEQEG